jgi:death on curing protein
MPGRIYLTIGEILQIHRELIENYGGDPGVRDKGLVEAAALRPQIGYYANILEEAAALMESLANNHAFIDGNKRIAFAAAHTFLMLNGYELRVDPGSAYTFIMDSLATGNFRFAQILQWLSDHTRETHLE